MPHNNMAAAKQQIGTNDAHAQQPIHMNRPRTFIELHAAGWLWRVGRSLDWDAVHIPAVGHRGALGAGQLHHLVGLALSALAGVGDQVVGSVGAAAPTSGLASLQ